MSSPHNIRSSIPITVLMGQKALPEELEEGNTTNGDTLSSIDKSSSIGATMPRHGSSELCRRWERWTTAKVGMHTRAEKLQQSMTNKVFIIESEGRHHFDVPYSVAVCFPVGNREYKEISWFGLTLDRVRERDLVTLQLTSQLS
jgi:hypothetical protein